MHENERINLPTEGKNLKKLEESLRKRFRVKRRVFGRGIVTDRSREIEEMREESRWKNI